MDEHQPRVSVGLPVYNGERFLEEAIESVLAQSYGDFELIICDNASTDRTARIIEHYARADARIWHQRNRRNLGLPRNFNLCFELAGGEYFKWMGADDVIAPAFLQRSVEALDAHPEAALVYPRTQAIDEVGARIPGHYAIAYPPRGSAVAQFRALLRQFALDGGRCAPIYIHGLIRTSALGRTRLMGRYPDGDLVLSTELALEGSFRELPEELMQLRVHPAAVSQGANAASVLNRLEPAHIPGRMSWKAAMRRKYIEYAVGAARSDRSLPEKALLAVYCSSQPLQRVLRRVRR